MKLVALAIVCAWTAAFAEPQPVQHAVALLPLDADAKLELYGQPVANEISHALVQAGLEVVLVGPKMAVPETARLVVDGTIKAGKGEAVTMSVRVRDARDGVVYDTLVVTADKMTAMDHAQQDLSAKVLPAVKGRLATLIEADKAASKPKTIEDPKRAVKPAPKLATMLAAISAGPNDAGVAALKSALTDEIKPWASHRHHDLVNVEPGQLVGKTAPTTVAAQKAELSVQLEVLALDFEADAVPLATARVRLRISDAHSVVFDRVIVTDSIVGDKGMGKTAIAARVAREVLAIADPQLKRRIPTWW